MSFSSDVHTALIDVSDAATILHYIRPKRDAMQDMTEVFSTSMKIQLERGAPRFH